MVLSATGEGLSETRSSCCAGYAAFSTSELEKLLAGKEKSAAAAAAAVPTKEVKETPLSELSYYMPMQRCLDLFKEHWTARVIPPAMDRELTDPTGNFRAA
ncbi:hypothetical protein FOZ63_023406 [Perkinsus olseni]|uniref:Uncharacterized protein n=1 Tax=Perkinsus olseni TaxID=32597 RepID=A0A7J6Q7X0_PEROL|nr:hypothetical protein FOZ63_023406 [Perkinsus olseni]